MLCLSGRLKTVEVINRREMRMGQSFSVVTVMLGGVFVRETTIQLHTTKMEDHLDKTLAVVPILWSRA